ncbi:MAG: VOC family protein [Dehalococcoidia bacterium]|nr:VOC family protein [Dehalococcoidia bacterium]
MITSFSHIYHRVHDVEASMAWYTKHLGFTLLRKYSMGSRVSGYLTLNNVLLELTQAANPDTDIPKPEAQERRLGLTTDNIDAEFARLRAEGVTITQEPYDARTFWGKQGAIQDLNGYVISLREWAAPDNPTFGDWQPKHEGVTRLG